jgi:hypothetical protein
METAPPAVPEAPPARRGRGRRLFAWLSANLAVWLVAFAMLWAQPYFERLNAPNELVRVYATMAIVDQGTYAIDGLSPGKYGWINDRSGHGGKHYACKAPGTSFLGVPVYWLTKKVAGWAGTQPSLRTIVLTLRVCCVVLPIVLFLLLFRSYLDERFGRGWLSDASVLACGLGSILFPFAHIFAGHALAAVSAGSAFMLLDGGAERLRAGRRWWPRLVGGGLLLGLTPTFEYPAVLAAAPVGVYALVRIGLRPWALLCTILPALAAIAPTVHFHWSAFGGPLTTAYPFVESPYFRTWHETGWLGVTYPRADRMFGTLLSPDYGLFFLAPVLLPWLGLLFVFPLLLLCVPLLWSLPSWVLPSTVFLLLLWQMLVVCVGQRFLRIDGRLLVLTLVPLLMILYVSSSEMWRGGWTVGPRFLTGAVPFLVLGGATLLHRLGVERRPLLQAAFAGLLLASLAVQVPAGVLYPHFPENFSGPLPEILFPLARAGLAPSSIGGALGLRGGAFWWPLLVVLAAGGAWLLWRRWVPTAADRVRRAGVAIAAAAALVAALVVLSPRSPEGTFGVWKQILRDWEPRAANPALAGPLPAEGSRDAEAWRAAGRAIAFAGFPPAGRAEHHQPERAAQREALRCYREAVAIEKGLPREPDPRAVRRSRRGSR